MKKRKLGKQLLSVLLCVSMMISGAPMDAFAETGEAAEIVEASEVAEAVETSEVAEAAEIVEASEAAEAVETSETAESNIGGGTHRNDYFCLHCRGSQSHDRCSAGGVRAGRNGQ